VVSLAPEIIRMGMVNLAHTPSLHDEGPSALLSPSG